jgi:hypothetical protein
MSGWWMPANLPSAFGLQVNSRCSLLKADLLFKFDGAFIQHGSLNHFFRWTTKRKSSEKQRLGKIQKVTFRAQRQQHQQVHMFSFSFMCSPVLFSQNATLYVKLFLVSPAGATESSTTLLVQIK